jgi:hypothetical protein
MRYCPERRFAAMNPIAIRMIGSGVTSVMILSLTTLNRAKACFC